MTERCLIHLARAVERKQQADENYEWCIAQCVYEGIKDRPISRVLGVTPDAVRMHRNRRGLSKST